jgi:hypothetical protein
LTNRDGGPGLLTPTPLGLELGTARLADVRYVWDHRRRGRRARTTEAAEESSPAKHRLRAREVMGTSVAMIERHFGTLIGGAHAGIAGRLDALEAELERAAGAEAADV